MGNDSISNKYYKLFNEKQKAEAFDKIIRCQNVWGLIRQKSIN